MSLFRLDASIRQEGSHSRALADIVEAAWREENPNADVIRRDIGLHPLASTLWPLAVAASRTPEAKRDDALRDAAAEAQELVDEVLSADSLLFPCPCTTSVFPNTSRPGSMSSSLTRGSGQREASS
jgi:FMN-dependent NADH-azoreductase